MDEVSRLDRIYIQNKERQAEYERIDASLTAPMRHLGYTWNVTIEEGKAIMSESFKDN